MTKRSLSGRTSVVASWSSTDPELQSSGHHHHTKDQPPTCRPAEDTPNPDHGTEHGDALQNVKDRRKADQNGVGGWGTESHT